MMLLALNNPSSLGADIVLGIAFDAPSIKISTGSSFQCLTTPATMKALVIK
jgi:hypothetical protein